VSRQREWAKAALDTVKALKDKDGETKFRSHALRLPTLIKQAGLAQALAFTQSRDEQGKGLVAALATALGRTNLLDRSIAAELPEYMALSREAIAAAVWFRRFAQSELKGEGA
jgi:CRISPR-associated protein Cmr5